MSEHLVEIELSGDLIKTSLSKEIHDDEELLKSSLEYNLRIKEIFSKNTEKKFYILMDIRNIKIPTFSIPTELFKNVHEITTNPQTIKLAVLGESRIQETVVEVLFFSLREKKANYFVDELKALKWLGATK